MYINRSISSQSSIGTESFHSAQSVASSSVRVLSEAEQTKLNDITHYLTDHVFAAHRLPVNDINVDQDVVHAHNVEIGKIISARALRLLDEGETALSIGETFAKAEKFDRMASAASGALRATPFAAAFVLQYMQPAINKGDPAPYRASWTRSAPAS